MNPEIPELEAVNLDNDTAVDVAEIDDDNVERAVIGVYDGEDEPGIIRYKSFASIFSLLSKSIFRYEVSAPGDSDLVPGRTVIYFQGEGVIDSIWLSVDGADWIQSFLGMTVQFSETGSDDDADWHEARTNDDAYLRFVLNGNVVLQGGVGTTIDDSGNINIDNPFSESDESKLNAIEAEATKNSASDGIDEDNDGQFSINDDYVDALIEGADVYLEHFRLPYTSSFFNTSEARWGSGVNNDPDIDYTIYMQPTTAHREIVSELIGGARMQVREVNGSVRNTFTLIADIIGPDSSGVFTLNGSFDNEPAPFVSGTNYGLYFSQSRPHSVRTGDTISGDGNETPLEVADDSLTDQHISDSLNPEQQEEARDRYGIHATPVMLSQAQVLHTSDLIHIGPPISPPELENGLSYRLRTKRDNDGAVTFRVGNLPVRSLRKQDGSNFGAGELPDDHYINVVYDSVNSFFIVLNITEGGAGETDLSVSRDANSVTVQSSTGDDAEIPEVSDTEAGVATPEIRDKAGAIPEGGTIGQTIKKQSDADYDTGWEDDEGDISIANEGTEVQAAADTLNFTGDGVTVTEENSGVEVNIPVGSIWVEHFTSTFRSSFFTTTGDRWGAANQSDGSGHIFIIHPNDAHIPIIEALRNGSRVQVRNTDDTIQNEFTLEEDAPDPDSTGNYQLRGDFDRGLNFANNTAYRLYFSESRRHEEIESRPAVQDEGTEVDANPEHLDFTGAGVTVTQDGEGVEIAIPGGGGGAGAAQRSESITFQVGPEEIENDGVVISPAISNAVDVTFPSTGGGNPEILDPGSDADGFVVLQRGIYYLTVRGLVVAVTARCTGQFRIYEYDADITTALPIGRTQNTYIRYQHTNAQPLFEDGILEIAEDNTAVKLVAISALPDAGQPGTDNSRWTLNAGLILKLYRTGIKGEPGDGVLDEISEADITDEDSSTVGGISGRRARAAVDAFADSVDTFHLTVDRNYITGTPNAANDITIVLQSGDVYDVGISRYTGAEALPETYLNALPVNTEIRLASGDTVWDGELQEIVTETDTSATLRIDFGDRTGTFTANDTVAVSFGYAPARVPRADEIEVEGDLDGTLFDADDDLESIIQSIDNFDLSGDVVDAGDDITIAGTGTETDPKVISNDAPFTDYDSDLLGELANTARHTVEDDLVLRLQYGAEHLFGGHDRVITGLTSIDGHIFAGSDEGFVNDERGINTEDLYDLTTNNNHPETAGNWYFGRESEILIRERNASGVWSNASPDEFATGIASGDGIGIGVDPENLTVLYFLHEQGDGIRIQSLGVAIFPSSGVITTEANHDITRASINSILTANDLQNISEIRDTNGNIGVTAMGARDDIVYFAVTGIEDDEYGIPSTVILRINTSGSGSSRTFTLDTEYVRKIGIRQNVQGLVPTATGFWIATEHVVYEYHESGYSLPEPGPDSDEYVVVYDEDTDSYILRTREGLPATINVDTAFFAGDGATGTPITLKSDITQANQETFRERIGVQRPAVAIFWGQDQTDRDEPVRQITYDFGQSYIMRFRSTAPNETRFGGDNLGDIMVSGTIPSFVETNIDNTTNFNVNENEVFQLPEGLWNVRVSLVGNPSSSGNLSIQLKQILSGNDDRIVSTRPGFTYSGEDLRQGPNTTGLLEYLYFETNGTEYFYLIYYGGGLSQSRNIAYNLLLEKL